MQCDGGSIPGHFDMSAEAKVNKVKAKCPIIQASLSLTWQGHIVYGQNVVILEKDVDLI